MIIIHKRVAIVKFRALLGNGYRFCGKPSDREDASDLEIRKNEEGGELMERNYDETSVPGKEDRMYSRLTDLQRKIIQDSKFDLTNPSISPKMAPTNSYSGIQDDLTEINLGTVKVKSDNEVFLSEVDPNNIPEELDIKFDSEKEMRLVGKQSEEKTAEEDNAVMAVKKDTFEEKSMNELVEKEFGVAFNYEYNKKESLRKTTISFLLVTFCMLPFMETFLEVFECLTSIH